MLWLPLHLSLITLLFPLPSFSAAEWRAPITKLDAYSELATCIATILWGGQATAYARQCTQTDLAVAASCLCSRSVNLASWTSYISHWGTEFCTPGAEEKVFSALEVVTEFCSVAPGGMSQTEMRSSSKDASSAINAATVTIYTGEPTTASNTARLETTSPLTAINAVTVTVYTGQSTTIPNRAHVQTSGHTISIIFVFMAVTSGLILGIAIL